MQKSNRSNAFVLPAIAAGLFLFATTMVSISAQAGESTGTTQFNPTKQIEQMAARLQLSQDQKPQFRSIMRDAFDARMDVLRQHGIDPSSGERPSMPVLFAVRGDMSRLRKQTDTRLSAVLSDAQMAEYGKIREEQRKAIRARFSQ